MALKVKSTQQPPSLKTFLDQNYATLGLVKVPKTDLDESSATYRTVDGIHTFGVSVSQEEGQNKVISHMTIGVESPPSEMPAWVYKLRLAWEEALKTWDGEVQLEIHYVYQVL